MKSKSKLSDTRHKITINMNGLQKQTGITLSNKLKYKFGLLVFLVDVSKNSLTIEGVKFIFCISSRA
jgi:hypothetical protein